MRGFVCCLFMLGALSGARADNNPELASHAPMSAIAPQPLKEALILFGRATGLQLIYESDFAEGQRTRGAPAGLMPAQSLQRLLEGTGLTYQVVNERTISIHAIRPAASISQAAPLQLAQAVAQEVDERNSDDERSTSVAELIVTGTHIRGAQPVSPVHTVTRKDIEISGYAQTGDLVRSMPQIYAGGQNPGVMQNPVQSNNNLFNSSTVNLRGIGADATLVLLNGHRMATESQFGGIDISGIPLGALERIEIVTDGSSALYGSDAVAGVANFILRRDFNGTEIGLRWGDSTRGGGFERTYSVLSGKSWQSGHVLASAEFSSQEEVLISRRAITASAPAFNNLIRPSERKSALISGEQMFGERIAFEIDAMYSTHVAIGKAQNTAAANPYTYNPDAETYFVAPSLKISLPAAWNASVDVNYARGEGSYTTFFPLTGSRSTVDNHSTTRYLEVNADGAVFRLPSGPVSLALGGGYREEAYERTSTSSTYFQSSDRNVKYVYAETMAPVVQASNDRRGLHALDASFSVRSEDYDRFGATDTYKIGLRYSPFANLALRATTGTSFKAPTLFQLSASQSASLYLPSIVASSAPGTVLIVNGGNPGLEPERSENWTAGFDWAAGGEHPLSISATYFDIDYTDRVVVPVTPVTHALSNPAFASFLTLNPPPAQQSNVISQMFQFFNNTGAPYDPASVMALIDNRNFNANAQRIYGIDLSVRKSFGVGSGEIDLFATATDLTIDQQTIDGAAAATVNGVLFAPPKRRMRGGATWRTSHFSATGILNHISNSTDTYVTPNVRIDSWTTLDLTLTAMPEGSGVFQDIDISFSISNALDEDPPYARGGATLLNGSFFDSTNASAMGRFVAFGLKKRF